jgi:8-oxo-dGTP diphosphatase
MKFEFSAGGVVYKKQSAISNQQSEFLILVCRHSYHHGWVFPKGLIGDKDDNMHEGKEETAIREVKEETGAEAEIEKTLTPVTYFYSWEGDKIKKTVYYFIMKYVGGDISDHDDEMEEVEWIQPTEVEKRLTYPSDKKVWREAMEMLKLK